VSGVLASSVDVTSTIVGTIQGVVTGVLASSIDVTSTIIGTIPATVTGVLASTITVTSTLTGAVPSGVTTGAERYAVGWSGLLTALRRTQAEAELDRAADPVACPHDGEPLEVHDGWIHCPWGDYTVPVGVGSR
jgi:hypothetical protein